MVLERDNYSIHIHKNKSHSLTESIKLLKKIITIINKCTVILRDFAWGGTNSVVIMLSRPVLITVSWIVSLFMVAKIRALIPADDKLPELSAVTYKLNDSILPWYTIWYPDSVVQSWSKKLGVVIREFENDSIRFQRNSQRLISHVTTSFFSYNHI